MICHNRCFWNFFNQNQIQKQRKIVFSLKRKKKSIYPILNVLIFSVHCTKNIAPKWNYTPRVHNVMSLKVYCIKFSNISKQNYSRKRILEPFLILLRRDVKLKYEVDKFCYERIEKFDCIRVFMHMYTMVIRSNSIESLWCQKSSLKAFHFIWYTCKTANSKYLTICSY